MSGSRNLALTVGLAGAGAWLALRTYRTLRSYDLKGRRVLITGGSRGLGLVLARELIKEGARVAFCARDEEEIDRAFEDLTRRGGTVLGIPCDVSDQAQVNEMVEAVIDRWGGIDVLINNAGIISVAPVELMTLADFEEAMKINFWSSVYTTLAVLPGMRRERQGRIVNITSIGGKISVPHLLPYDASKFAMVGLSEGLRAELAKDGIVVTTVVPGLMRTGSPVNAFFKGQHRKEYTWFALGDALPGMSMSAERAARNILAACKRGDPEIILTIPARIAVRVHGLLPGLTSELLGLVNRFLPGPGGIGTSKARGKESESGLAPSVLTTLSDQASRNNNELVPGDRVTTETGARVGAG